jgi:hypothetical protein
LVGVLKRVQDEAWKDPEVNRIATLLLTCLMLLPIATAAGNPPAAALERLELARNLTAAIEDEYDFRQVVELYRAAAADGVTIAKYELAELLSVGRSEWADYITAARLYKEAAAEGHRPSRCICGWMFAAGMYGQDVDYPRAHALMTLDGQDICTKFENAINRVEGRMSHADHSRAQAIATSWLKGDAEAVLELRQSPPRPELRFRTPGNHLCRARNAQVSLSCP